jgi:DNA-binding transcriptional ArsR family regulator
VPDSLSTPNLAAQARAQALAPLSGAFVLDQAARGMAGMDGRDAMLVMAINQANIAPLTRDPDARLRYGGLESPAPDDERRPVSLSAIAASLRLPYETVRRRARRLAEAGVIEVSDQGAIVPESFLASPAYLTSVVAAHARLYGFFQAIRAAGLMEALPASRYPPEPQVPIRASLRPLADYLLRTIEGLMALTGDLIAGLAFLGLVSAGETLPPPVASTADLARRLAMPHETVRRHLAALADAGWAQRSGRGFTVSQAVLDRPAVQALFRDNAVNLQRLFTQLAERGVVEAWDRLGAPGVPKSA